MSHASLTDSPLGKKVTYSTDYQRELLFSIPRKNNRAAIGVHDALPFIGSDIWTAYEISWLNAKGKPMVAGLTFTIPCESPNIVESKSIKLYLNSFNNTKFDSIEKVATIIQTDLSDYAGSAVSVDLTLLSKTDTEIAQQFSGICIDDLDISCDTYLTEPNFLVTEDKQVTETLFSDLLRSNCPITGQPDWGSVQISYSGKAISHEGLLKYIVSLRNHDEFHEQCVERIFVDIMARCQPEKLMVFARYTRRGGIDINPYRANYEVTVENQRLWRQ